MRNMFITLAATALVALLAVSGCSKPAAPADGTPPPGPAASVPKIAGMVFQEDQFFRLVLFGMRDAAKKAGVELLEGNSAMKPEKEIQLVNTYVARKVDAIILSPISAKGSVVALKQAADKGIKVVTYNTSVEGDLAVSAVASIEEDLGAQTGKAAKKYIEEKLGGKAKIAVFCFKSQAPEQSEARVGGFKKEVGTLPGVEFVAEQDAWLPELGVKRVGDVLTANPEVNIIWAANEGGTVGAVMAVKNADKVGQVAVFGTDASEQLLGFLQSRDNILQAITSQRPTELGRLAVENALKAIKGEAVEKKVSLPGVCLSRTDPAGVAAFAKQLQEWIGAGSK
jgi:ABC-type sugar transport system substrate-binding protein